MPEHVRQALVEVEPGVSLSVSIAGRGPALLLVHGWRQSAALFQRQIDRFSATRQVIAPDMRGHGQSPAPPTGYSVTGFARDLKLVLDDLEIEACDVVGHSMGCAVIWAFMEMFGPERFGRIALVDQAPLVVAGPSIEGRERAEAGAVMTPEALEQLLRAMAAPFAGYGYVDQMLTGGLSAEERDWVLRENRRLPREHAVTLYRDMAGRDWRSTVARTRQPVLVFWGERGAYPEASQRWIARCSPQGRFVKIAGDAGGGHLPFIETPDLFNGALEAFLDERSAHWDSDAASRALPL